MTDEDRKILSNLVETYGAVLVAHEVMTTVFSPDDAGATTYPLTAETETMKSDTSLFPEPVSDTEMERRLCAATAIALESFSNSEIAAFNLAITRFAKVAEANISFEKAKDAGLINEGGSVLALEETTRATAFVINQRMKAGTFNYPARRAGLTNRGDRNNVQRTPKTHDI